MNIPDTLQQGIAAAKAGRKHESRQLLSRVIEADEQQPAAWWWLSQIVDSLEEKEICLENVLTLDPDHDLAQAELAAVKHQRARFEAQGQVPKPPKAVITAPDLRPIEAAYPLADEFDNEWLCPFCLAPTRAEDNSCPVCHNDLIAHRHKKKAISVWLWRGILFQFIVAVYALASGLGSLTVIARLNDFGNVLPYLPLYFWQPVEQPETSTQLLLAVYPRWVFWGFVFTAVYSIGLMVVLYLQLRNGDLLYLVNAGLVISLGIVTMIIFRSALLTFVIGAIGAMIGIVQLIIASFLWRDFGHESYRLRLALGGPTDHVSLFENGYRYGREAKWGLAIIHLRRAVVNQPLNLRYRLALITAYLNVRRTDLARQELEAAKKIAPLGGAVADEISKLEQEWQRLTGPAGERGSS